MNNTVWNKIYDGLVLVGSIIFIIFIIFIVLVLLGTFILLVFNISEWLVSFIFDWML